ncbi:MAG TPA: ATP-binding cassette domain-containing protein [Candidatus Bilamarchaeum sp.]|nr:ATP-binding cassette domain-containing protein [Candidatus Bilamarchaeum sp.]
MSERRVAIISIRNLTKKFGTLTAVDGISLEIKEGEIFGLLGPNGAGKTTTISMLVTMRKPTAGSATVNGFDVVRDADSTRRSIGIVFQDPSLDEELTAYENLELHAAMYGLPPSERGRRIREVAETVELTDRLRDLVKTFSGGMRRRLEIARGLLHYPKILFLDEPTIGLDPQTRKHVWDYIKKLKDEHGITVVMTTHYMEEADSLCDRIAIIDHGKIIADGTPSELKDSLGGDIVVIKSKEALKMKDAVKGIKWVKGAKMDDGAININVTQGEKRVAELVELAGKSGVQVLSVGMHKPTLDDVFLYYTGRDIRAEGASVKDSNRMRMKAWGRGRAR